MHILIGILIIVLIATIVLFILFPRTVGVILILVIGGSAIWYFSNQQSKVERKELLSRISLTAKNSKSCPQQMKVELSIHNGTDKTIESVTFNLALKETGFSSEVISSIMTSDKIISPNETYTTCWDAVDSSNKHGNVASSDVNKTHWVASIIRAKFSGEQ